MQIRLDIHQLLFATGAGDMQNCRQCRHERRGYGRGLYWGKIYLVWPILDYIQLARDALPSAPACVSEEVMVSHPAGSATRVLTPR